MTRKECEQAVARPGKFEHEPPWTPYFYNLMLDGRADQDEHGIATFEIDRYPYPAKDSPENWWPELLRYREVRIWEDANGFVHASGARGRWRPAP